MIASAGHSLTSDSSTPTIQLPAIQAPLASQYAKRERSRRRKYEERVREVEGASFVLLVFSTTGGMGPACAMASKRLAYVHERKA